MLPEWLKIRPSSQTDFSKIKTALRKRGLVSVCEEAQCPNMAECWHQEGTATFMVMGDVCTRGCKFCAVATGLGRPLDPHEPQKLAEAIAEMGLGYAVITSVARDDLADGGASHIAQCIIRIKKERPETMVEVLIPDFRGNIDALKKVVEAKPEVIAHNIETVERLQRKVRDWRANYAQSLAVLRMAKALNPDILTKSAIMVGVGESQDEVVQALKDLRRNTCDIITIGQYLKPKSKQLAVEEYIHPDIFSFYKQQADALGFAFSASGPFVRSSYRAGELYVQHRLSQARQQEITVTKEVQVCQQR